MTEVDLSSMTLDELKNLEKMISKAVSTFDLRRRSQALRKLEAVASEHGFSLAELTGTAIKRNTLSLSMQGASTYENWYSDEIGNAKSIIEAAHATVGLHDDILVIASEWSTDGTVANTETYDPGRSLKAAASTIAAISTLAEMGVDYATTWGIAAPYKPAVQVSYYDAATNRNVYTPRGEALRMASEVLTGTKVVTPGAYLDAWKSGPVNLQAFSDNSKLVLFLSANDLPDGATLTQQPDGYWVTFDISNLADGVSYAWAETLNVEKGISGKPVIWNPLLDVSSTQEKGETWLIIDGNTVSVALHNDFEMIRIVIGAASPGDAPLYLLGDSRAGFGITADNLVGGAGSDQLFGLSGHDSISGDAGGDYLYGGDGNDAISGGSGNDAMHGDAGADTMSGGTGDDAVWGDAGDDVVRGEDGTDTLFGGDGRDFMFGGSGADSMLGGIGNDQMLGDAGNDILRGEAGDDLLYGGDGADTLDGGADSDILYGGVSNDDLRDVIFGGDGNDSLYGGAGNDSESGGAGNDTVFGDWGADTLIGNDGNDQLSGGGGADVLFGNSGSDWLNGGFGSDRLNGGSGADFFFHLGIPDHGSDWVQDYSRAEGDVLVFGNASATMDKFQVNFGYSVDSYGQSAGRADIAEAFVIYKPTGTILWALVDGAENEGLSIQIGGLIHDYWL